MKLASVLRLAALARPSVVAMALVLPSCGSNDVPPPSYDTFEEACAAFDGCGETRFPTSGATERIFRIELIRDAEASVRIGAIDSVDVPEGVGVPVGPSRGTHLMAARDAAGAPIDGQIVAFPETLFVESLDDRQLHEEVSLATREVDTIAYVRALPDAVDLALLELDGTLIASAPLPAPEARDEDVGRSEASLIASTSACSHVVLIDGSSDRHEARNVAYVDGSATAGYGPVELLSPGPMQRAAVDATLGLMPPLLCHTISRIVFGRVPGALELRGAVAAAGGGDTILVNVNFVDDAAGAPTTAPLSEAGMAHAESRALLARILFHEAGHSVAALLNAQGSRPRAAAGDWIPAARSLAETTIANVRLEAGLTYEWQRMHDSFERQGWAQPFVFDNARKTWSAEATTLAGGMSRYGTTSVGDNFCEMLARPATTHLYVAAGIPEGPELREDFGCQTLRAHSGSELPATLSAVYAKLRFLQDLGLLADADFEACVGPGLMLAERSVGLHLQQEGGALRSFTQDTEGGLYTLTDSAGSERHVFSFEGGGRVSFDDTEYAATATITLDVTHPDREQALASWPRGVFRISPATLHTFDVDVPDRPAASFSVTDGFVLVTRASNARVEGSVFITEAMRWGAPVPVAQIFDPPLTVRFRYE